MVSDNPDLWTYFLKIHKPLEVKDKDKKGKWKWSSEKQRKFCEEWDVEVVGTPEEALRAVGAI